MSKSSTEAIGCSVCGNMVSEGTLYVEKDSFFICRHCVEELDLCDILDFLELKDVISLLMAAGDYVKTKR